MPRKNKTASHTRRSAGALLNKTDDATEPHGALSTVPLWIYLSFFSRWLARWTSTQNKKQKKIYK